MIIKIFIVSAHLWLIKKCIQNIVIIVFFFKAEFQMISQMISSCRRDKYKQQQMNGTYEKMKLVEEKNYKQL